MAALQLLRSLRRHVSVLVVCWVPLVALWSFTVVDVGRLREEAASTAQALRAADALTSSVEAATAESAPPDLAKELIPALLSSDLIAALDQADPSVPARLGSAAATLAESIEFGDDLRPAATAFHATQFVARGARRERMAQISENLAVGWAHLELTALLALALAAASVLLERREYRRRAEARSDERQTREDARLYREFFQADPSAALVVHAERGLIEHANVAAAELYGGQLEDLVGQRFSRLDPRSDEALLADLRELSERGVAVLRNHTDLRGRTRSLEVSVSHARSGATRYRVAVRDGAATQDRLRHLGRENRRLEATLAAVLAPVVVCDVEGRISWFNSAAQAVLGSKSAGLEGVQFPDLCVGAGESSAERQLLRELDYHRWPHRRTLTLETREGDSVRAVWHSDAVRSNTGAVHSVVHTLVSQAPLPARG